jgi:hypothetical protein
MPRGFFSDISTQPSFARQGTNDMKKVRTVQYYEDAITPNDDQ